MVGALLTGCAFAITVLIIWIGRKRRVLAISCACGFLLYAAILIPNILPPRTVAAQNPCVSYLRLIRDAKADWAARNHKSPGEVPAIDDLFSSNNPAPYHWVPQCPSGGEYKIGAVNQNPTCTLSNLGHVLR
jgi:hypothetical protein